MMKLNVDLPDSLKITRLDFGYVEAFSRPYTCWLQVEGKFYRGRGDNLQSAYDNMLEDFKANKIVFEQRKALAKQDITEIF